jgi:hypothetical protein
MPNLLRPHDYFAAALPPIAALTLSEINAVVGIAGGLLGIAYLLWKWRKEWSKGDSNPPFPK